MGFYARPSWRLAKQLGTDVFVVLWGVAWWFVSRFVDGVVRGLAAPARQMGRTAEGLRDHLAGAADAAGKVPIAGDGLRGPLDDASSSTGDFVAQMAAQVRQIETTATVTGWLVFLIPVLIMVALWLPPRLRFARTSGAARRFIDSSSDLDLFALRAMATSPMHELARISDDPVAAWRSGDPEVVRRLAELELRKEGLSARHVPGRAGRTRSLRSGRQD